MFRRPARWFVLLVVLSISVVDAEEPASKPEPLPSVSSPAAPRKLLPTPDEARNQAELLHESLHATLQTVHHQYYREDEGLPIPAAALKNVFRSLERDRKLEIRWLAVNAQAMNVDHQAKTDFEKEAVKAIAAGKESVEETSNGLYRHVGSIALTSECLKCHAPMRKNNKARLAGLLIGIPVRTE